MGVRSATTATVVIQAQVNVSSQRIKKKSVCTHVCPSSLVRDRRRATNLESLQDKWQRRPLVEDSLQLSCQWQVSVTS